LRELRGHFFGQARRALFFGGRSPGGSRSDRIRAGGGGVGRTGDRGRAEGGRSAGPTGIKSRRRRPEAGCFRKGEGGSRRVSGQVGPSIFRRRAPRASKPPWPREGGPRQSTRRIRTSPGVGARPPVVEFCPQGCGIVLGVNRPDVGIVFDSRTDSWIVEWMNGRTDGRLSDGWTDGCRTAG
jgi:hypothetical protein